MTTTDKNPQEQLIIAMSPLIFVISCLCLAIANGFEPSQFGKFEAGARQLLEASWFFWVSMGMSLLIMFVAGVAPIRQQFTAMVIGLAGSISLFLFSSIQLNWLVTIVLLFVALIPAGNLAFRTVTASNSKS